MTEGGFEVVTKRGTETPFNEARGPRPSRGAQISGGYRGGYRGGRGGYQNPRPEGGAGQAEGSQEQA